MTSNIVKISDLKSGMLLGCELLLTIKTIQYGDEPRVTGCKLTLLSRHGEVYVRHYNEDDTVYVV